jgi:endonuclease/exonuclease/phosphatase family metal-dependent hydrolase
MRTGSRAGRVRDVALSNKLTNRERIMRSYHDLTVGVFNIERFGYDGQGHHRLPAALDFLLEHTSRPPDVLALPEARRGLDDGQQAIRRKVVHRLSQHLDGGWYEALFASRKPPGRRNHLHLLLVNTATVHPLQWHDPHADDAAYRDDGFAVCEIFGHEVNLCCEHWSGGEGRAVFDQAANRVAQKGGPTRKTLLLGDFNADSGWDKEFHHGIDWQAVCEAQGHEDKLEQKGWFNPGTGRWEIDTRQLDKLRTIYGFRDMGEEAGDPTVTTHRRTGSGLRIDRIFRSAGFPADLIDYNVRQPPQAISDHAYVFGAYRFPAMTSTCGE